MTAVDRIISILQQRGITKNQLLQDCGLSKNSFVNWEKRGSDPGSETIKVIAEYLGVTSDFLLGVKTVVRTAGDGEIKFALFNGADGVTDEMYEEVKAFAAFVKQREQQKGKNENK